MDSDNAFKSQKEHNDILQQEAAIKDVRAMMEEDGPVVRALLLKTNGSILEVGYDSTTRNDHISKILGGAPTILGEVPDQLDGVILTKKLTPNPLLDSPNQHKVLSAYGEVLGDVFVTRLDKNSQPQHFGLAEYEAWLSSTGHDGGNNWEKVKEVELADLDDKNEFDWDAEDTAEEDSDFEDGTMKTEMNAYMVNKEGKVPRAAEVKAILGHMGFNVVGELSAEEEREMLAMAYESEHGEKPTSEKLDQLIEKLPRLKTGLTRSTDFPEDEEDEDWVPPEVQEETSFNMGEQVESLAKDDVVGRNSMDTSLHGEKLSGEEEFKNAM